MNKAFPILLALALVANNSAVFAESNNNQQPPEIPAGIEAGQTPPAMPEGAEGQQPPQMPADFNPGQAPDMPGGNGGPGGAPGGMSSAPEAYDAVQTITADTALEGEAIESTGTDENAVLVTAGSLTMNNCSVTRNSEESAGGDSASFYGVGAAILATGGSASITNSVINTTANGAAGVFAYGDGVIEVADTAITTTGNTAGGIHAAGGGTLIAHDLTVETSGASSAAIRSDRGGGTMTIDGGSYTSNGTGSPAVYVTANISITDADLTATGSEALCLEGLNSIRMTDCNLTGNMSDDPQNDNTWTVILYQSMSGDSEVGKGTFTMNGGSLTSLNGGLFYTTNTESEFVLSDVSIITSGDSEYFLRCTGNANQRGWGQSGANGADCTFTAINQEMNGDVIWDSISNLNLFITDGSVLSGAIIDDESCAGEGGSGTCKVVIDAGSTWIVTGSSVLTDLQCEGTVMDLNGDTVSVIGTDGTVYVEGTSQYSITCNTYSNSCDLTGVGTIEA